jgi:hypothetical protein
LKKRLHLLPAPSILKAITYGIRPTRKGVGEIKTPDLFEIVIDPIPDGMLAMIR